MDKATRDRMRVSSHLLPPPGGEVVRELLDELDKEYTLEDIETITILANAIRDKELADLNVDLRPFSDGDIRCVIRAMEDR